MHSNEPIEFTWTDSRIPLVNGEVWPMIFFGPHLQRVYTFEHENETYGCFESVHNLPQIQQILPLDHVDDGHTFYMTSLEYDGNPYYQVLFVWVDTTNKKMYSSWVCGRAEDQVHITVDPNTFAFDFIYSSTRRVDVYQTMLEAARKARAAM